MRTREETDQILAATWEADPGGSDPDMDLIRDLLNWVNGDDTQSAQSWLDYQGITDVIEDNRTSGKLNDR